MEARNRQIPEWFNRVRTGQIRLPRFQRHEAWGHGQVGSLLEAVLRGLPCGATLILEIGDTERFVSRPMIGAPPPTERATEHLLDGQQRLTALWRSFRNDYDDRTYFVYFDSGQATEAVGDPRVYGQARWLRGGRKFPLWADDPVQVNSRGHIPLALLRPEDIGQEIRKWCDDASGLDREKSRELERLVYELRLRVATYNIPFLSLPAQTPKDVALDVFIKLNTTSVELTAFDIVVAQLEGTAGESLHDLVEGLNARVPTIEDYTDAGVLVLDAAAMRQDMPPTLASYQKLDLKLLIKEWDDLVDGMSWAISMLEEERVFDADRLPTVAVLPVLGGLYPHVPRSLDELGNARILVRKYLWRSFLTRRYENAAATRAHQDLRSLVLVLKGTGRESEIPIFDESQYPLPSDEEIRRAGWPKSREILARGVLAVSLRVGAMDLADGIPATRLSVANREYHHLFPDSLLVQDGGLPPEESFRALNCALITWNTNRNISAKEPIRYLKERAQRGVLGEEAIRTRLASHLIPFEELNVGGYGTIGDPEQRRNSIRSHYEAFLARRAKLLSDAIASLAAGREPVTR